MKQATFEGLPEKCYAIMELTGEVIQINRGIMGYFPLDEHLRFKGKEMVDILNDKDGVTPAQREAMKAGSLWGWYVPAANPLLYNEDGTLNKERVAECVNMMRTIS